MTKEQVMDMGVLTCEDCGNTDSFVHREVIYERVFYVGGEVRDSTSLDVESSEPVRCYECDSTNIERKD